MSRIRVQRAIVTLAFTSIALAGCGGADTYQGPAGPGVSGSSASSLVDAAYSDTGFITSLGIGRAAYASRSLAADSTITDTIPMNVASMSGALDAGGYSSSVIDTGLESNPFDDVSMATSFDGLDSGSVSPSMISMENDMSFDSDTAVGCNGDTMPTHDAGATGIPEIDDELAEQDMAMLDAEMDMGTMDAGMSGTSC